MRYRVSMPEPHSHLFEVEATLDAPGPSPVLALPVWTPGSYLVREFSRHLEGIEADDGAGRRLPVTRLDKHRFQVEAAGASQVRVRYRVYANDPTVRTSHLDGTHGYFNGANLFLYAEGRVGVPVELTVDAPRGWKVATALDGGPARFTARDYHELCDSPVEVGTHELATFEALGKRHEVAIAGRGHVDVARFVTDLRRIVEHLGALMGGLPYERYLFIVHVADKRRGGLEHERSTTLDVARSAFFPREAYEETLALAAHEFLHLWNVKRLRPAAFHPYDYAREQYTRLLWWFEGATSYYDRLSVLRAGLGDAKGYLRHLGEQFTALARQPGAGKMSLEEASLTAWVKYYRPDENSGNSAISYYQKGELVALSLDLALRRAGGSLDDLLRALHARYAEKGLPEDGVERAAAEVMGEAAARDFFDRFVRGTAPLEPGLDLVGLALHRRAAQGQDDKGGTPPRRNGDEGRAGFLGAEIPSGAKLVVRAVREGSPASQAGLYADDEILAESGFRVDRGALWDRMRQLGPGGKLRLTVFRRDELTEVEVTLGPPPEEVAWLEPFADATPAQKAAFQAWTGAALP
ncbi:MAG: PDZ domain-containing protein [Anaeromyxobacteraceae bacterium]